MLQKAALSLIQDDLRFLYTVHAYINKISPTFIIELSPYLGLVIDGIEDWIHRYNNSSKTKLKLPVFTEEEKSYYEKMRLATKIWGLDYIQLYEMLQSRYTESNEYFRSICRWPARVLHLYDIYGVYLINREICGNSIIDACYMPDFSLIEPDGQKIKNMAVISGKYMRVFCEIGRAHV